MMIQLRALIPSFVVLGVAVLILLFGPTTVRNLAYHDTQARMLLARERLADSTVLEAYNRALRDIAEVVEPSVVHISAEQAAPGSGRRLRTSLSSGSGWVYDDQGHIVTNYHVVADADSIEVQLASGEMRPATLVGSDASTDIAVLRVRGERLHPAVRADPREPVRQGDLVFAFGSPFDFRFSMSSGIVSGQGRFVDVIRDRTGRVGYENFIQVDAAINPGNSGGPLTDFRGHVIGMNTAIATGRRGTFDEGQFAGIGLAIPLSMIQPIVEQIIDQGYVEKGYLGVEIDTLDNRIRAELGAPGAGVYVRRVTADSPADRAGLQPRDVVLAVNGETTRSRTQLQAIVSSLRPGASVTLDIWRPDGVAGGSTMQIVVDLARLDSLVLRGELPPDQPEDHLREVGIARMRTATPDATAALGVAFHPGVLVEAIVPGSELENALPPGSIIVAIQDWPVTNTATLLATMRRFDLRANAFGGGVLAAVVRPDGSLANVRLRARR